MKKRSWRIRRDGMTSPDAQRRWDRAYQLLIQWSQAALQEQEPDQVVREAMRQEECDESGNLCAGVYATAGTNANH